ncbi:ATP-dependent DNA helicase PIF1 [Mycena sanguinolenta]|uniref:ATP-dependent DNA helicase PIF1 n=1 Tax=Mycena sanguinolenta TaxID=230812 RepID=A0A8H6Z2V8_9AGAR|nr:ATP-dependent DNA helicase PIF1 [Mycena sanguinolenta]
MGQVLTALRHAIRFAFGGDLSNHLFANLPVPTSDLTGRTFIITGSNTGIGFAAAVHLARLNPARLVLGVRDLKKGEAAKARIIAETRFSSVIDVWDLDMADFGSVKRFAERAGTLERLDGALLNAGMNGTTWQTTRDGWERTLQVNALSQGLLGILLLPLLHATATRPDASPHLTFTGSAGRGRQASPILTKKLRRSHRFDSVVEPGFCVSELMREHNFNGFVTFVHSRIGWSSAKGSLNLLYAALKPTPPGAYVSACKIRQPESWTSNKEGLELQKRVWNEMVEIWCCVAPEVAAIVQI